MNPNWNQITNYQTHFGLFTYHKPSWQHYIGPAWTKECWNKVKGGLNSETWQMTHFGVWHDLEWECGENRRHSSHCLEATKATCMHFFPGLFNHCDNCLLAERSRNFSNVQIIRTLMFVRVISRGLVGEYGH